MGCEINLLRMYEYINMKFRNKQHGRLWSLFIDLKSAFDTVDHKLLFEKMRKYEIDE